jgi:membrane protease YdiL (CAAX protease family)
MLEVVTPIIILLGIILTFHGIFLFYFNRKEIKTLYGFLLKRNFIQIFLIFFIGIGSLFSLLIWLNDLKDFVKIEQISFNLSIFKRFINTLNSVIFEEFIFRIFVFSSIIYFTKSKKVTILTTSILFSFFHFPENILHFLSYFLGGVIYGYAFVKFQSILIPIFIHFLWNFFQGPVLGFPVSGIAQEGILRIEFVSNIFYNGGGQGPEGSILGIIMRIIIILLLVLLKPRSVNEQFLGFKEEKFEKV